MSEREVMIVIPENVLEKVRELGIEEEFDKSLKTLEKQLQKDDDLKIGDRFELDGMTCVVREIEER